ncbi:MAG TPA: NADH-quinone oxidoreductase subunit L [Armatimonadota bacterium]|jgi:NADH-quinone oxidoreductase subunit L
MVDYAFLIPLLPLLAYVVGIALGPQLRNWAHYVSIGAILAAFAMALGIFAETFSARAPVHDSVLWATYGSVPVRMGVYLDHLTAMMLVVVTTISLMVQIYSTEYMHGDRRYSRYFAYLSLFSAAMLGLVLADNLLLMLVCWELVGLSSYLLIGFWFEKPSAMRAAKKAFVVTHFADLGFAFGLYLLFAHTQSFDFATILSAHSVEAMPKALAGLVGLLLFCGACGKSAQFPLHVWLPDAMEGPTPVSALIHAATMVAAGVFMVGRMYPIFEHGHIAIVPFSLIGIDTTLGIVACVGAVTTLVAATIGIVMTDIKKVLAYSTVSQLGFMMLGLGVGGYTAGLFHLMTHAFFKALLFLGSGSVIHGTHTQEMWEMGGLRKKMPVTFATFMVGYLALSGFPLLAGWWSKDEILLDAWNDWRVFFWIAAFSAFLTAFYMTRLMALTFFGSPRNPEVHAHESGPAILGPLVFLAVPSVLVGFWGYNHGFAHYLHLPGEALPEFNPTVALIGSAAGLGGLGAGWLVFGRGVPSTALLARLFSPLYTLFRNKWYIDELWWNGVVVPLFLVADLCAWLDRWVVDLTVNAVAWLTQRISGLCRLFDTHVVDGAVNLSGWLTGGTGELLRRLQTGRIQNYLMVIVLGVLALLAFVR